jgi:hypothetical protein
MTCRGMVVDIIFNPEVPLEILEMGKGMDDDEFSRLGKAIVKAVKNRVFCHGEIRYKYVQKSIKKSPYLFLAYNDKQQLCGFATVFHINNETLRIDIICTSEDAPAGTGRSLMETIENFAKVGKIKTIFLKSIGQSMGFYQSLGYSLNINADSGSNNNSNSNSNNNMDGSNNNSNSNSNSNSSGNGSNNNMDGSNSNSSSNSRSTRSSVLSFAGDILMSKKIGGGGTRRHRRSKRKSASRKKSR